MRANTYFARASNDDLLGWHVEMKWSLSKLYREKHALEKELDEAKEKINTL